MSIKIKITATHTDHRGHLMTKDGIYDLKEHDAQRILETKRAVRVIVKPADSTTPSTASKESVKVPVPVKDPEPETEDPEVEDPK